MKAGATTFTRSIQPRTGPAPQTQTISKSAMTERAISNAHAQVQAAKAAQADSRAKRQDGRSRDLIGLSSAVLAGTSVAQHLGRMKRIRSRNEGPAQSQEVEASAERRKKRVSAEEVFTRLKEFGLEIGGEAKKKDKGAGRPP
jgi:hypothetical protein